MEDESWISARNWLYKVDTLITVVWYKEKKIGLELLWKHLCITPKAVLYLEASLPVQFLWLVIFSPYFPTLIMTLIYICYSMGLTYYHSVRLFVDLNQSLTNVIYCELPLWLATKQAKTIRSYHNLWWWCGNCTVFII